MAKKPEAAAPAGTKKTIVVMQTASAARRPAVQTATLKGLGLNKIRRTRFPRNGCIPVGEPVGRSHPMEPKS